MISTNDLYEEINGIEELIKNEKDPYKAAMLKVGVLQLKLLQNIRTNTVKVMEKFGIERIKPKKDGNGEKI